MPGPLFSSRSICCCEYACSSTTSTTPTTEKTIPKKLAFKTNTPLALFPPKAAPVGSLLLPSSASSSQTPAILLSCPSPAVANLLVIMVEVIRRRNAVRLAPLTQTTAAAPRAPTQMTVATLLKMKEARTPSPSVIQIAAHVVPLPVEQVVYQDRDLKLTISAN